MADQLTIEQDGRENGKTTDPSPPHLQDFLNYLHSQTGPVTSDLGTLIFECCHDYRKEHGSLPSEVLDAVKLVTKTDDVTALISTYYPNLFTTLHRYQWRGRKNWKIRETLSSRNRIGFISFLVIRQLTRLGGRAALHQLQGIMSGCHGVLSDDLILALRALQHLGIIEEEINTSKQWWNPKRLYAISPQYAHLPAPPQHGSKRCGSKYDRLQAEQAGFSPLSPV